eukprot:COSAG05_NODE_1525_length_4637_cov_17.254958_3_plen_116_part_00
MAAAADTKLTRLEILRGEVAELESELGVSAAVAAALARLRRAERVAAVAPALRTAEANLRDAEATLTRQQARMLSCCSSGPGRAESQVSKARQRVVEARQQHATAAAANPSCMHS